jgi:hypothetical protein
MACHMPISSIEHLFWSLPIRRSRLFILCFIGSTTLINKTGTDVKGSGWDLI